MRRLVPRPEQAGLAEQLHKVFAAHSPSSAKSLIAEIVTSCEHQSPRLADELTRFADYTLTCFDFPAAHRRKVSTTNSMNRFKRAIGRRASIIRVFPNDRAFLRLLGALAMEQSEEWLTSKRYLNMSPLEELFPPSELARGPHSAPG